MAIKFEIVDGKVIIPPSSLTIPELKNLWDRDKKKSKQTAYMELTYVYHMSDPKSEYADFSAEHKESTITADIIKEDGWKPDEVVQEAITKYKKLLETASLRFLNSQEAFLDKVTTRTNDLETEDLEDDKTLTAMLNASEKASKLIMLLPKLKEAVVKEQSATQKIRGGGDVGSYER